MRITPGACARYSAVQSGPWSTAATFKSPIGGYITANEIYDPLYTGKTVGGAVGSVTFTNEGARLDTQDTHVRYQFANPLTTGEFSVMIKGADEGAPGDKSKVFAMQQGDDADITTNSYRFTAELRGRNYVVTRQRLVPHDHPGQQHHGLQPITAEL